jgi:nucleotide-binding universal stress UspA family protein
MAAEAPGRPCVVAGYDRHPAAQEALRCAADLAGRLGARLLVVHVVGLADYPIDPDAADWEARARSTVAAEHGQVRDLLEGRGLDWEFVLERGDPAARLAEVAARAHAVMTVIGTQRHRLAAGPVTRHLTRRSRRPVLLVPVESGLR